MSLRRTILIITAGLVCFGCFEQSQKNIAGNSTSLGTLQTRNNIIRLETGDKYSVLDLQGNPVASSLTKQQFQEKFPQLYNDLEKAIANGEITIDASAQMNESLDKN